jgi:hypothetical protein
MANRSKALGTSYESQCVRYLRQKLCDDGIERRALHGNKDMGDVFGLKAHGHMGIVECKNVKRYGKADIDKWRGQTMDERKHAGADFALLVVHKPGCGEARFGDNYCHLQVRDLDVIQGYERYIRDLDDPLLDTWLTMDLETACDLMLR